MKLIPRSYVFMTSKIPGSIKIDLNEYWWSTPTRKEDDAFANGKILHIISKRHCKYYNKDCFVCRLELVFKWKDL